MLKKLIALSGTGLIALGLASCDTASSSSVEIDSVPTPVIEGTVIGKNTHTETKKEPIYGAPTVEPGMPNPYMTSSTKTTYQLTVIFGKENINPKTWEVSEFAYNICEVNYTAVKYSDGDTVCYASSPETEVSSETSEEEEPIEEESTEPVEEPLPTYPNGFANSETTEEG